MLVGYARTSTLDQTAGLEAQEAELTEAGCEKLFAEQVSSVDVKARERLTEALEYIREGDTLVVTKLDRLARSVAHLLEVLQVVTDKGASLRILSMGIDTGDGHGQADAHTSRWRGRVRTRDHAGTAEGRHRKGQGSREV